VEGLRTVNPAIPLGLTLRDLDQEKQRERLRKELGRENEFRLEMTCQDWAKALDRLSAAFKAKGIRFVMDPEVSSRLKNRRSRLDFAIYTEGLTGDELAAILEKLGKDDRHAESKRKGDGQFNKVIILPLIDRKELSGLLGVDPLPPPPAKSKTPLGQNIRQPIAETTTAQVIQTLEGQGTPRPEAGKPVTVKASERLAIVVSYQLGRSKSGPSKEVRQFLDSRKERNPGTLQMLLVVTGPK
jgi:hypothetical protein